jgi:hypothetical protein
MAATDTATTTDTDAPEVTAGDAPEITNGFNLSAYHSGEGVGNVSLVM